MNMKKRGESIEAGDKVVIDTWAYALSTKRVTKDVWLMPSGLRGTVVRVHDANSVVVRYENGLLAPVNISTIRPR